MAHRDDHYTVAAAKLHCDNIEHAIELAGGMGTFQYKSFTVIIFGMNAGAFFLYSLPYFEKQPQLECQSAPGGPYISCSTEVACSSETLNF